jgi:cbb3-type cytochrome oxidase cytochrome c subunit
MKYAVLAAVISVFALLTAGCQQKNSSGSTAPSSNETAGSPTSAGSTELAAGRQIFNSTGCARCHAINGQGVDAGGRFPGGPPGGPGVDGSGGSGGSGAEPPRDSGGSGGRGRGGRGPDLGHVGAEHTADWIAEHVRDPQSHKPRSRMPKFPEEKISEADLRTLAEYLAGLK